MENIEIEPHKYAQVIFDKRAKSIQIAFPKNKQKKMNLDLNLTSYTKIASKWIIDLNVKHNYKTFRKNKKILKL